MDCYLYARLLAPTELETTDRLDYVRLGDFEDGFADNPSHNLADTNRPDSGVLIKGNEAAGKEGIE